MVAQIIRTTIIPFIFGVSILVIPAKSAAENKQTFSVITTTSTPGTTTTTLSPAARKELERKQYIEAYISKGLTDPIMQCIRAHESSGNYQIRGDGHLVGGSYGAWQFRPATWDMTVVEGVTVVHGAGYARPDLLGKREAADPATQDFMALTLRDWPGTGGYGHWTTYWRYCK